MISHICVAGRGLGLSLFLILPKAMYIRHVELVIYDGEGKFANEGKHVDANSANTYKSENFKTGVKWLAGQVPMLNHSRKSRWALS